MKKQPVTFIDLGAFNGDSVLRYLKAGGKIDYAHLFEPNPEVDPRPLPCPFSFYPVGAWIHQGSMPLYRGKEHGAIGASFYKDGDKIAEVPVINFPRWLYLQKKVCPFVVKMNIEGAEYELLDKMCDDGAIDLIDVLYLSLHDKGLTNPEDSKDEIRNRLEENGLTVQQTKVGVYNPNYFQQWVRI